MIRYGEVSVTVSGGWGNLEIDGNPVGTTPYTGRLTTGSHQIRVYNDAAGYDLSQTITVKEGELVRVPFAP